MSSPIEILNEKIDTDKEILSVMPKNTKKNAELYVKKVTEIKENEFKEKIKEGNNIALISDANINELFCIV